LEKQDNQNAFTGEIQTTLSLEAVKNSALIQLLRSWREGDEQEQRKTWEYLKQALDEDRLSERKLFP